MGDANVLDGHGYSTSAKSAKREEARMLENEGRKLRHFTETAKEKNAGRSRQRLLQLQQYYSGAQENAFLLQRSCQAENFAELEKSLLLWLQEILLARRKMVLSNNLFEELRDGYVLSELLDVLDEEYGQLGIQSAALSTRRLPAPTGSGTYRLQCVVDRIARTLVGTSPESANDGSKTFPWSVEGLAVGDELCVLRLLVAIIDHYQCPVALPQNVSARVVIVTSTKAGLQREEKSLQLTGGRTIPVDTEQVEKEDKSDSFDQLFETSPENANAALTTLLQYSIKKAKASTSQFVEVSSDLSDGILLLHLACLIGQFFVRMCDYYRPSAGHPLTLMQKTENVRMALQFLRDAGVDMDKVTITGILEGDPVMATRLLYRIRANLQA